MKHLRRVLLTLMIMSALIIGCSAQVFADEGGYTIKNYEVNAVLHDNNVVSVTEKITVNFYHLRHGIYRTIPVIYQATRDNGDGNKLYTYKCKVENIKVKGGEWTKESNDYAYIDIKIGDKKERIKGNKTYVISYDYKTPDDRVSTGDMLYFSLLGDMWNTKTDKFTFSMKFDKALKVDELNNIQVYSGPKGERSNALEVKYKATKNKIYGSVKNVPANNAITLYAPLREGYYKGEMRQTMLPSIAFLILMLLAIALTVYLVIKGRHKMAKVEICALAPDKLCPAEIGTIIDETVDDEDVLSLIPWFAQQGYLTIEEREKPEAKLKRNKTYAVLHKVQNLPEDAPFYQKAFFMGLFSNGDTCDLSNMDESFASDFDLTKSELQKIFRNNRKLSTGGTEAMALSVLIALAGAGFVTFSNYMGIIDIWVGALISAAMIISIGVFAQQQARYGRYGKGKIGRIGIMLLLSLVAIGSAMLFCDNDASMFPLSFIGVAMLLASIGAVLTGFIIRPTEYKQQMMSKVVGFKKFIHSAEIADLEDMQKSNPNYFYEVLPYAMAFGMGVGWAKRFMKVKTQPKKPEWYTPATTTQLVADLADVAADTLFDILHLTKSIETNVSAPITHSVDSSKSSSSDGGSSGGGGGGGGGGSW